MIFHAFLLSVDFFQKKNSKNSFKNTFRASNGLDPDQDRQSVGPDLGPNCLQRLSADDTAKELKSTQTWVIFIKDWIGV